MNRSNFPTPPVAVTIAGSDCSAGAGIQADLKTFEALGVHGLTAVTAVVSEAPGRVDAIQTMPPEMVASQIRVLFETYPVKAAKTGMLASAAIVDAVIESLPTGFPLVVDPVMVASSGDRLGEVGLVESLRKLIRLRAQLVTPNLTEAAELAGFPVDSVDDASRAARAIAADLECAVLVTGGHLPGDECVDVLVHGGGEDLIRGPRLMMVGDVHGTGCTLSAAITAGLARGLPLSNAVREARGYIERALRHHRDVAPSVKALAHGGNPVQD